jgi:hypothetical protein
MHSGIRFRINKPKVIHETFEDEVVILNLDSGNYFSLNSIGTQIFDLLECGTSIMETLKVISGSYKGNLDHIEKEISGFVDQLILEELIVPLTVGNDTAGTAVPCGSKTSELSPGNEMCIFESPVLQKYTDMQELLLLDPIHDVDDMGWPIKPKVG